jgi:hypothetical protein
MKWLFRLFSAALLVGALSMPVYLHYKQNGSQISLGSIATDIQQKARTAASKLQDMLGKASSPAGAQDMQLIESSTFGSEPGDELSPSATKLYQWQDESGQWHFSDAPPEDQDVAKDAATRVIDSKDVMTVPAITLTGSNNSHSSDITKQALHNTTQPSDALSIESAVNVMDNAKAAAQQMERRNEALKEIVGEK